MPCGYDAERVARGGRDATPTQLAALGAERVVAVDASGDFSRPGPRLVDGLELLAHILHPRAVPQAPGTGARRRPALSAPTRGRESRAAQLGADHRDDARRPRSRPSRPQRAPAALARGDRQAAEHAADEAADVPADRDVRDDEREPEVEEDRASRARSATGRSRARRGIDDRRAHQPEDRARGADRRGVRARTAARRTSRRAARRSRCARKRGVPELPARSSRPSSHSRNMLKPMCSSPACRKPEVTRRHHSPSATGGPNSAPSRNSAPLPRR